MYANPYKPLSFFILLYSVYAFESNLAKLDYIYCLDGTSLVTLAAADALIVIDFCAEVFNLDCIVFASLYAFHTAYATCFAGFSCECALVVVGTQHSCLCLVKRHKLDNAFGTSLDTSLTCTAGERIDSCYAVTNVNGIIWAGFNTVTKTDTAVDTFLRTAEKLSCHFAAFNAAVNELCTCVVVVSLTEHNGCLRGNFTGCEPCNSCNLFGNLAATGSAKRCAGGFALGKCGSVAVAT